MCIIFFLIIHIYCSMNRPKLTEPGVMYFFDETLKNCRKMKYNYFNTIYNTCLAFLLLCIVGTILYFTYNTKNNEYLQKQRTLQQELFITSKIKQVQQSQRRERGQLITNIPEFEQKPHDHTKIFL